MKAYSFRMNLRHMAMIVFRPRQLIVGFSDAPSVWYGLVPFFLYITACEFGWLSAYATGYQQAINPLPKFLPIPDDQYLLYQAIFGPFIKAAGIFIFGGSLWLLAKGLKLQHFAIPPVVIFFTFISSTMALLAIAVDQVIIWSSVQGALRFALSTIHPIALVVDMAFVVAYVGRYAAVSLWRAIALVIPGIILAVPLPGMLFR